MLDKFRRYSLYGVGGIGWIMALFYGTDALGSVDQEAVKAFFGEAASNQIAQAGFFFTIAAWLHSGRVKKEIKANFASLTSAINNVAESLRQDLKNHTDRLDNLTARVEHVENNLKIIRRS